MSKHSKQKVLPFSKDTPSGSGSILGGKTIDTGEDYKHWPRCYESHTPLDLGNGLKVYGGSCHHPMVDDADVYVGLDLSMKFTSRSFPWEPCDEFLFHIADGTAPKDSVAFVKLVDWLAAQITAGRKCHVGCIGGHGRTGMVLAALAKVMLGEDDAVKYVRDHYCKKVVETTAQIEFLNKVFGIIKVEPAYKLYPKVTTTWSSTYDNSVFDDADDWKYGGKVITGPSNKVTYKSGYVPGQSNQSKIRGTFRAQPFSGCMFGPKAVF